MSSDKLTSARLDLGLHRYSSNGITKLGFLLAAQEFLECIKEIAITTVFDVKKSVTTRRLEVGELVEVIGEVAKDEAVGLERAKCRALGDKTEGFVTLRGNQGTPFMKPITKPFYICEAEAPLVKACDRSSVEVCRLKPYDVLEVMEGPSPEPTVEVQRVRGKASKDGKSGWVTLKDLKDQDKNVNKLLVCSATTALTDAFDIVACKALRKVEKGEMLEQLEEPKEDTNRNLTRVRVKSKRDGADGWVTMKGNQGTAFVSEASSHRLCRCNTALHNALSSNSKVLRTLEEDEIFEVIEGPKTEKREGVLLAKGRTLSSSAEGWFDTTGSAFVVWSPLYTCVESTALRDGAQDTAQVVRSLQQNESLSARRQPSLSESGVLHVQVEAEKDGAVGFAVTKEGSGAQGKVFLKPVL